MQKRTILYMVLMVILLFSSFLYGCNSNTTSTTPVGTTPATTIPATSKPVVSSPTAAPPATTAPASGTTPLQGGLFTMISPNVPSSFGYPIKAIGFAPIFAMQPSLQGFIDADLHGTILPRLATSWEIAPDKSSITFHLRQGVKFHDGTAFNADAAKWNLDLFLQRGTGSPADWKSIEVVDNYTIRVSLKNFKNTQLSNFTYGMISPTAVQKNSADWAVTHPMGTGPFLMTNFVPNTSMEFTRFNDYWGDKALVDGMKFIYIVDATTAAMAYQGGDALVWESSDPQTAYKLTQTGNYKEETRRGPLMNLVPDSAHADSPFSKLEVRAAVEYAINRPEIVNTYGYNSWEAVNQPDAPEQFGHVDNLQNARPYNPDMAKQLLATAGYPNGFTTTIITSSAFSKDPLVAIQGYLKAVGITANIDVQSPSAWAQTRAAGWTNGLFYVTHGATDYNYCAYLERYYTPTSSFAYPVLAYPAGWVDTVNQMMLASDPAVYQAQAKQLVQIHVTNAMLIPLWIQSEVYLENVKVHDMGVGTHGDGFSWNVNKVWISK